MEGGEEGKARFVIFVLIPTYVELIKTIFS